MACPDVMPLPTATDGAGGALATPAKAPVPHLDSSLITSAIRKRKGEGQEHRVVSAMEKHDDSGASSGARADGTADDGRCNHLSFFSRLQSRTSIRRQMRRKHAAARRWWGMAWRHMQQACSHRPARGSSSSSRSSPGAH